MKKFNFMRVYSIGSLGPGDNPWSTSKEVEEETEEVETEEEQSK